MNIQITSRKFRAKDSLKDFINSEAKSLTKYNDDIIEVNVVLSFMHLKDSVKTAEIMLKVPGKVFTVSDTSDEFRKAVAKAILKMERQLKKLKTKRLSRVR